MTTPRRKVAAKSERFVATWHKRPWLTLSTIATAVAILASIGPMALAALHYFTTHEEFVTHQKHDESKDAWAAVQLARIEATQARNRVNDCNIQKASGKPMSLIEASACATYGDEYNAAVKRFDDARTEAMATTKEK
jgi:hypothetical protein